MADVFISYARSTASEADLVAAGLRALGYGVWKDDELPAHRAYADVIEERLRTARAVVVIWSADAAQSEWVRSEADRARADRKLVQLSLGGVRLPMPFDQIQCADLAGWSGDLGAAGWRKVAASVAALMEAGAPKPAPEPLAPKPPAEPLLAVLAFDNLSGDPEMAYFSDGVSEEIRETVARGAALKVIGRASSFQFRGADKAAANVAAQLGATHVLDGSVRRSGPRVRISTDLVQCANATTLWSQRFDRELTDIFALQDEIAAAVAEALRKAFAPRAAPSPIEPAAYESFLRAVVVRNSGAFFDSASRGDAIALVARVIERAPTFARAWELLAFLRVIALRFGGPTHFATERAAVVEAAETALRLDPTLGGAYAALGELEPWGAYRAREALFAKGLEVSPNDAALMLEYARFCSSVGRRQQGTRYADKAQALDPLLPMAQFWVASGKLAQGSIDEGLALMEAFHARWPDSIVTVNLLSWAAGLRRWDLYDRWVANARAAGLAGQAAFADVTAHAERLRHSDPAVIAAYADACRAELAAKGSIGIDRLMNLDGCGLTEVAFELIEAASFDHMFDADGAPPSGFTALSIVFIPRTEGGMLRDPRFVRFCAKLGLLDYWLETDRWPDCADQVPYDFKAECQRLARDAAKPG